MLHLGKNDWRRSHGELIIKFMQFLGQCNGGFVLKDGTALMLCYGLTRFSEDIDLDGYVGGIEDIIPKFAKWAGVKYRTAKNTPLVKRYMIQYDNPYKKEPKPLKIEVSYRSAADNTLSKMATIMPATAVPSGVLTYNVQTQLLLKLAAFLGRDKIRDLYDVVFLGLNYMKQLDATAKFSLQNALAQRGLEHFDYIIRTQQDELIAPKELEDGCLKLWDALGLI